jgi:hypothetical protein
MVTLLAEEGQGELAIVHVSVLGANVNPVTEDVGLEALAKVAVPLLTLQLPVPDEGVLAARVAEVPQTDWFDPALEVVGLETDVTITSSVLGVQLPLEIVQRKVLGPVPRPVMVDAGSVADVIVPAPLINVHAPVPDTGVFPARVAEVPQTD